jgi:hypothetical protein
MNGISVNGIVRMGALNSFEEITSINWHLKFCNNLICLCLGAKKYLFANEFVQINAMNLVFKELL